MKVKRKSKAASSPPEVTPLSVLDDPILLNGGSSKMWLTPGKKLASLGRKIWCTAYWLSRMTVFTSSQKTGSPLLHLKETQCPWYLINLYPRLCMIEEGAECLVDRFILLPVLCWAVAVFLCRALAANKTACCILCFYSQFLNIRSCHTGHVSHQIELFGNWEWIHRRSVTSPGIEPRLMLGGRNSVSW